MGPNRGIGWNTVDGQVMTSGEVRFEEILPDRMRVEVTMNYADPPGCKAGEVVAEAISSAGRIVKEDLQNFAGLVERGELGGVEY